MKKGVTLIVIGSLLCLAAFSFGFIKFFNALMSMEPHENAFLVPGQTEVQVTEPGEYYLWNVYQTVYEGRAYNQSSNLPNGVEIDITDAGGHTLDLDSDQNASASINNHQMQAIGRVLISQPGAIQIEVSGDFEQRVFSFSQFRIFKMMRELFALFAACSLVFIIGCGLLVWGIMILVNHRDAARNAAKI